MGDVFGFLQAEWPEIHEAAQKAADAAFPEPRTACFYARRALELAVMWAYRHDRSLSPIAPSNATTKPAPFAA